MPSGVVRRDRLRMRRSAESRCASITPCTPVTQTYPPSPRRAAEKIDSTATRVLIASMPTPSTFTRRASATLDRDNDSVGAVTAEYGGDRSENDADAQPDRPTPHVLAIQ